jgi:hypothetical protein
MEKSNESMGNEFIMRPPSRTSSLASQHMNIIDDDDDDASPQDNGGANQAVEEQRDCEDEERDKSVGEEEDNDFIMARALVVDLSHISRPVYTVILRARHPSFRVSS